MRGNVSKARPSNAGTVSGAEIENGSILAEKLADGAVINRKLADGAVSEDKLSDEFKNNLDSKIETLNHNLSEVDSELSNTLNNVSDTANTALAKAEAAQESVNYVQEQTTATNGIVLEINNRTFENAKCISRLETYSTTPTRVGTWIDGTPIWRMAIERTLDASEKSSGYFNIREDISVLDSDTNIQGVYINSCFVSTYSNGMLGEGVILKCIEPFYYMGVQADHDKAYGWVEFATAEENLNI